MWAKQSHLLHPLTSLKSNNVKFKWTDIEHKAFDKIKRIVARDTILINPDINKYIDIHTDDSDF